MGIKEKAAKGMEEIKKEAKVLKGEQSKDKSYSTSRHFEDEDAARFEFSRSRQRLFNVNAWSDIPGVGNANFELYSREGKPLRRNYVQMGDFVKIDLPGPLPFFWVKVTEVKDEPDHVEFTVQPTYDPTDTNGDKTVTDHFFQDQAKSIFRIERTGQDITAMEIGLNEAINNKEVESGAKALVNTVVATTGWAGLQKYQWKNLTDYLVGIRSPE
jgi:hypothetical protein